MPAIVTERPYRPVPIEAHRKLWTRSEVAALEGIGLFSQQRLELVAGELINKMGKKQPHVTTVAIVDGWLGRVFGGQYVLQEAPIDVAPEDVPTSEPEPDLVVLAKPYLEYQKERPRPADIRLAVEVSDSSIGFDLTVKAELYARAGIAEYWVVDIGERQIVVHRDPRNGVYQSVAAYNKEESVTPLSAPHAAFRVGDAFPD